MVYSSFVSSPREILSPQQALRLANVYLKNAYNEDDGDIALVLCHDTEISLSQATKAVIRTEDQNVIEEIATAYIDLGNLLESQGYPNEAKVSYKKAGKQGANVQGSGRLRMAGRLSSITGSVKETSLFAGVSQGSSSDHFSPLDRQHRNIASIPARIFAENMRPLAIECRLPEPDERLTDTPQLAYCLYLLNKWGRELRFFHIDDHSPDGTLDPVAHKWLNTTWKDQGEQERLKAMATEVIKAFKLDGLEDAKTVAEVVYLAPVLNKESFRSLLSLFHSGIGHLGILKIHQLEGLAQLIKGADQGHLSGDDLVKTLDLLSTQLKDISLHKFQLILAVSHVVDAMADTKVTYLNRKRLHEPLSAYLKKLKESKDPYLVYQAAYAFQALLWVPDDETTWQAAMRRTEKVIQGVSGVVSVVKGLYLKEFVEGLGEIQKCLGGVPKAVKIVKNAYDGANTLAQSGQDFLKSLQKGFSFDRKRDWYPALRGADALIQNGELATFRKLVCEAPCRLDPAFQWGVCQRLGDIAVNQMWDTNTRGSAIEFLGEIYSNDEIWGQNASVKQWILNILMQLAMTSETGSQLHSVDAGALLCKLELSGDDKKQAMYLSNREKGPMSYPLKVSQPKLASPSLLDRVQNRPDLEGNIRLLRKKCTKERGNVVYIPPQAKASVQAANDTGILLMDKVREFLYSDRKVFLLLGESGAGKSTFNRELEYDLWQSYRNKGDRIPLHINLPVIDNPEHDMIAKQLRMTEFTEPQICEMKRSRKFILICDGYDESQQTHNLYMSNRFNQDGEWDAQMVISCRTEYLGANYRDRFLPGDRNQQPDPSLFQEAVIALFSLYQVQDYIRKYVDVHRPLWEVDDYEQALERIPSLKDLARNPFLMTRLLELLPRMVDSGQRLSEARVTRAGLYGHFIEQWLEQGKKRLVEKDLNVQARAAFESLNDEGFIHHGIEFMKKLAVAIYKEQDGHPIVRYSRDKGQPSWKSEFFSRDEEKRLLREACPLTRTGNQYHQFIHRSLLEYALARAIADSQDTKGSQEAIDIGEEISSPLVWRNFINDSSVNQFLEERVQDEPLFKQRLLEFIELSKTDNKWCTAAANAITILVKAGMQFNNVDFQGIRIPGADLSYGVFDSAQLQEADLENVNFCGAWLRQADLTKAQMSGAQFGELPSIKHESMVLSCAYSPYGTSLAVGLEDGDINVYSTSNWEKVQTLRGHDKSVRRVVYSSHGSQIASASWDMTVRLWDVESGTYQHTLTGHTNVVNCVTYSPRGDQVASASDDKTIRLWDIVTGDCLQILSDYSLAEVSSVAYSPESGLLVSGGMDQHVRLWNIDSGKCFGIHCIGGGKVLDVVFSPQGHQYASASYDRTVRVWDTKKITTEFGIFKFILSGHSSYVCSLAYSPKGDQIASGCGDGTVRLWDAETGHHYRTLTGHTSAVSSVVYSPEGNLIVSGCRDGTVHSREISARTFSSTSRDCVESVLCIKYSPEGGIIVSRGLDNTIQVCDMETRSLLHQLCGHSDTVISAVYSSHGDQMVSASKDKTVRLWDMRSGECHCVLSGHSGIVYCVAFSPQGDEIASSSNDKTVLLWDLSRGYCRQRLSGHSKGVRCVVYSPEGIQVASCSADNTVRLWDTGTGACSRILSGHTDTVLNAAYSPQGHQLASASADKTVRTWDVEAGECLNVLQGHDGKVTRVRYSDVGDMVASSSLDGTVRLWSVASGQSLAVVEPFQSYIFDVTWSATPEGNYLVTGCRDGSLHIWQTIREGEQCHVRLRWGFMHRSPFTLANATIQDAHGLNDLNKRLFKQHGAEGTPASPELK